MNKEANMFIVICRDDTKADGSKDDYMLATSRFFETVTEAVKFAAPINSSREPLIAQILKKDEDSSDDCGEVFGCANGSPRME